MPGVVLVGDGDEVAPEVVGPAVVGAGELVRTATVGALDAHGAAALPLAITVGTAAQIGSYGSATLPLVVTITTNSGQQSDLTDVETGYISFGPNGQLLGPITGRVVR